MWGPWIGARIDQRDEEGCRPGVQRQRQRISADFVTEPQHARHRAEQDSRRDSQAAVFRQPPPRRDNPGDSQQHAQRRQQMQRKFAVADERRPQAQHDVVKRNLNIDLRTPAEQRLPRIRSDEGGQRLVVPQAAVRPANGKHHHHAQQDQ